jgi:ribosome maturation factor RimP
MNFFEKNIYEQIQQVVDNKGFFLIDLVLRGERNNRVIEVYVDSEVNVSAEDCAEISREIDKKFEEENVFESGYRLEVSSPGVNRPLKYLKQFTKHINRKFDVSYRESDAVKKFSGILKNIEGNCLVFLKSNREEIKIDFSDIIKAKVIISFS